jgi:FkbM family methyltransferase
MRKAMMITVEGHTFDGDLLGREDLILDAGCRGFNFSNTMADGAYQRLVPIDPDPEVWESESARRWRSWRPVGEAALVGESVVEEAVYVGAGEGGHLDSRGEGLRVKTVTISNLVKRVGTFGLAKLDIEGSEYGVLLGWPGPVARQISVEFHEHMGWGSQVHGPDVYERIRGHLSEWYTLARWDSKLLDCLWVLR